jgi:hypothetical protein
VHPRPTECYTYNATQTNTKTDKIRKQMQLHTCKYSDNAGPQYIKVLHEAHEIVISVLQNQFGLYHNNLNSTPLISLPAFCHYIEHQN